MGKTRYALLFLAMLFSLAVLVSCPDDAQAPNGYDVAVPVFIEGSSRGSRVIDWRVDDSFDPLLLELYCYMPPFKSFSTTKLSEGSEIEGLVFGKPLLLEMALDSDSNYVFEGSNDSDFIKLNIANDNRSLSFLHALSIINGDEDNIVVVVLGEGSITASGYSGICHVHFISDVRSAGYECQFYSNGTKCVTMFYHGQDGTPISSPPAGGYSASDYLSYMEQAQIPSGPGGEELYVLSVWDLDLMSTSQIFSVTYDNLFQADVDEFLSNNGITDWTTTNPN